MCKVSDFCFAKSGKTLLKKRLYPRTQVDFSSNDEDGRDDNEDMGNFTSFRFYECNPAVLNFLTCGMFLIQSFLERRK